MDEGRDGANGTESEDEAEQEMDERQRGGEKEGEERGRGEIRRWEGGMRRSVEGYESGIVEEETRGGGGREEGVGEGGKMCYCR